MKEKTGTVRTDRMGLAVFLLIALLGVIQVCMYFSLGYAQMALTAIVLESLILLMAAAAWRGRMPFLLLIVTAGSLVLRSFLNYSETTHFATLIVAQGIAAGVWAVTGSVLMLVRKFRPGRFPWLPLAAAVAIVIPVLVIWKVNTDRDRRWDGHARHSIWAVPEKFDTGKIPEQGTLEELEYSTRAYATDGRSLTKRALVYLPYGYDAGKRYNILYLMHGTGDDEYYWLKTNGINKTMLDRMIALGEIDPLIVVTPTFYVENDCMDGLDALTFSFRDELRNDLMPAVESRYSTWAETPDDRGFAESRDHRAFAGLSRGAVTTGNAVLCGCPDYFSWFGLFSSFRTTEAHLRETLASEPYRDLPIHYVYATTGNFDFATPSMVRGYGMLTDLEPRLVSGVNTSFDLFPMRYHSAGHWHLALYNLLQKLF